MTTIGELIDSTFETVDQLVGKANEANKRAEVTTLLSTLVAKGAVEDDDKPSQFQKYVLSSLTEYSQRLQELGWLTRALVSQNQTALTIIAERVPQDLPAGFVPEVADDTVEVDRTHEADSANDAVDPQDAEA